MFVEAILFNYTLASSKPYIQTFTSLTLKNQQSSSLYLHSQPMIDVGLCMGKENALLMKSQLQPWMRSTLLGEEKILTINTPTISIKDRVASKIKGCIGLNLCKIRGLNKKRDNPFSKKLCFNIWPRMKELQPQMISIQSLYC